MSLTSMIRTCGDPLPPGTKAKLYVTLKDELNGFPATVEALKLAMTPTPGVPVKGDKRRLGEAFDFSEAPSGFGYWREYDILVDTGQLRTLLEGEFGGQGFRQRLDFFLLGNSAIENENADDFVANGGCMIAMIGMKAKDDYAVLGDLENPVWVETAEGGSGGERVGFQYTFYANTGRTPYFYDSAEFGIDTTPNTP
jgi:hypothetical protein